MLHTDGASIDNCIKITLVLGLSPWLGILSSKILHIGAITPITSVAPLVCFFLNYEILPVTLPKQEHILFVTLLDKKM